MAKIVVALGGNALGDTPEEQIENVAKTAVPIVDLVEAGHQLVLCHGNGPQVGMISVAFEESSTENPAIPVMPLAECTALSQGYIGYHLQQGVNKELANRGQSARCATVVTEVLVDPDDPAFQNPTKPIGAFLTSEQAEELMEEDSDLVFKEDAGRGWRRYVASPRPQEIVQAEVVTSLSDSGHLVIACGGGGIPVVPDGNGTRGVPAVIDKDRSAAKLAEEVGADSLVILTAVEAAKTGFRTPKESVIGEVCAAELEEHLERGEFAEGSMKPKVEAILDFVKSGPGRQGAIGSLDRAAEVLAGASGTRVTR